MTTPTQTSQERAQKQMDDERTHQAVVMAMYTDAHLRRDKWQDEMYPTFYNYLTAQLRIAEERGRAQSVEAVRQEAAKEATDLRDAVEKADQSALDMGNYWQVGYDEWVAVIKALNATYSQTAASKREEK